MKKFYAAHECANTEIAVFNSKEKRDDWVNHRDWFSKEFETVEKRVALSAKEAYSFIGSRLYNINNYISDSFLDDVMWIIARPSMVGVI